jgi:uncharacterized membrane protein (Fun14 family)
VGLEVVTGFIGVISVISSSWSVTSAELVSVAIVGLYILSLDVCTRVTIFGLNTMALQVDSSLNHLTNLNQQFLQQRQQQQQHIIPINNVNTTEPMVVKIER